MKKEPLLIIVGPTGVGKTDCSLRIARWLDGEIVSGDSMQIYQGMDIGTAKVSKEEQAEVAHYMIDQVPPDHLFSVQEYQRLANKAIQSILQKGKWPILVGGTGLYVDAVVYNYQMPSVTEDAVFRQRMMEKDSQVLMDELQKIDPVSAKRLHVNDRYRVIRALEVYHVTGVPISEAKRRGPSVYNAVWVGLTRSREKLYEQINWRVDSMLEQGLLEEVRSLVRLGYDGKLTSMQAIGYKEFVQYIQGDISYDEAVHQVKKGSRRYAKRQLTWFRRNPNIQWFDVDQPGYFEEIQQCIAGKFLRNRE